MISDHKYQIVGTDAKGVRTNLSKVSTDYDLLSYVVSGLQIRYREEMNVELVKVD